MFDENTSCQRLKITLLSVTILLLLFVSMKTTQSALRVEKHVQEDLLSRAVSEIERYTKTLDLQLH